MKNMIISVHYSNAKFESHKIIKEVHRVNNLHVPKSEFTESLSTGYLSLRSNKKTIYGP